MKKKWPIVLEIIFVVAVLAMSGLIIAVSKGYHPSLFGYQVLRVLTKSMSPALEENSIILIKKVPMEEIQVDDIITFISDDPVMLGVYNTHRVFRIETEEETGKTRYITKGDWNEIEDLYPVYYEQIAGKLIGKLPFGQTVGRSIQALEDRRLFFVFLILPLLLCFISYVWQIFFILVLERESMTETEEAENQQDLQE